jgi:hypothetical protein
MDSKNLYQILYRENIHISELPAWHDECGLFNLQIFNNRGNVIYKKKFNDTQEYIQLFYTLNRQYKLIIKLDAFSNDRTRSVRKFCYTCLKYHAPDVCDVTITIGTNDTVKNKTNQIVCTNSYVMLILRRILTPTVNTNPLVIIGVHCTEMS